MTTFDRIERRLPELIDDLAAASVPDYFDDMLQQATRSRQRPRWSAYERWLPMGDIARSVPFRQFPTRPLAVLLILGAAIQRFGVGAVGYRIVVVPAAGGGPAVPIGPEYPAFTDGASMTFSPDGKQILATYFADGSTWLLDLAKAEARKVGWETTELWSWQRRAD